MILKSAHDSHENINPLQCLYPLLTLTGIKIKPLLVKPNWFSGYLLLNWMQSWIFSGKMLWFLPPVNFRNVQIDFSWVKMWFDPVCPHWIGLFGAFELNKFMMPLCLVGLEKNQWCAWTLHLLVPRSAVSLIWNRRGNPVWLGLCLFLLFHKPNFISPGGKCRWHDFSCSRISPSKSKVTDVEILTGNVNSVLLAHRVSFANVCPKL